MALIALASLALTNQARADEALLADLTLDRVDQKATWRLGDHVPTTDSPPPEPGDARALYIQFGFLGCAPCERLAHTARELLDGHPVTLVYIHLDDVLMSSNPSPRAIWKKLYAHTRAAPYDTFVPLRRGSTTLMRALCGDDADPPSGLLILPDGTTHAILRAPDEDAARDLFTTFRDALDGPEKTP